MTTTHTEAAGLATAPGVLFQGYDTFSGKTRSAAVKGKANTSGGRIRCDYTVCTSTDSLLKSVNVSTDVAASFGVGSVEAKAEYVNRLETTSTSVIVTVYANVILGTTAFETVELGPDVEPPGSDDLNDFYHHYGDSWISAVTLGGEYIASYVFYSQSVEEQTRVVAALKAKGVSGSGQVSVAAQTAVEDVTKSETMRTAFKQEVFGFSNLNLPKPDQLVEFALGFSTRKPDAPTLVEFETTGYEHVRGMSKEVWGPIRDTRSMFTSDLARPGLAADVVAITELGRQIKWLREVYGTYGYSGDTELLARNEQVKADRATLGKLIDEIRRDPTRKYETPKLESLGYGVPALKVSTPAAPVEWGRQGGDRFDDVTRQMILDQQALTVVTLVGARLVDRIISAFGPKTVQHGGGGGQPVTPLRLQPGEFITVVKGRAGKYVDNLSLSTSEGQTVTCGRDGGDPFEWTVPAESVVVGFAGRSGAYIDRIGPMICTFKPAVWVPASGAVNDAEPG